MKIIQQRNIYYIISLIVLVLCLGVLFFAPKNLGIDMTGGIQITYSGSSKLNESTLTDVSEAFYAYNDADLFLDEVVYLIEDDRSVRLEVGVDPDVDVVSSDAVTSGLREHMLGTIPSSLSESSFVKIGNSLGSYVRTTAIFTLIVSIVLIAIYLTYAFRGALSGWSNLTFGLITLITLMHDVVIATGVYVILGLVFPVLEMDTFFVTALLTILGYSINDTIVVLDRIRSNLSKQKKSSPSEKKKMFQGAILSSVRRSIFTSATLLIVLLVLLFIGPVQLVGFVALLIVGTIIGTYSSLFIAAPLVYDIQRILGSKK